MKVLVMKVPAMKVLVVTMVSATKVLVVTMVSATMVATKVSVVKALAGMKEGFRTNELISGQNCYRYL